MVNIYSLIANCFAVHAYGAGRGTWAGQVEWDPGFEDIRDAQGHAPTR